MSLATKNVATVFVGLGLILALSFSFALPVKADMLSDLQAQVQMLLAQIQALSGGSSSTSGAGCNAFTRTHQMGDSGGEVMWVQQFLNSHGAVVSASGAGSVGNETSYYGAKTKAAVAKWQGMNGVAPAAGYWGPLTRAKVASVCSVSVPGVPGVPVTGNGLKVMLASDSPSNKALVDGQAIGELAKFTFVNPTGSEVTVTNLGFKRIGVSNDSTLTAVYLYNGATRITDSAGISSTMFNFNDTNGVFKVPAGGTVTISVRANVDGSSGEQIGVQLLSVAASSALDTSVVLPISGGLQTLSSATLGTVAFTYTGPSGATENPANDIRVFEASTVVSTHAAWLQAITFENRGTSDDNDLKNLKLFVDGVQVGPTVAQFSNNKATFDLSSAPKSLATGTRIIKVVADVVGGSSKTYDIQIRRAADANIVDAELNAAILTTDAGGSFPVSGSANTIGAASLSIVRATNSPTDNIAVSATNVLMAKFEVRASGENVKIETITVDPDTSMFVSGLDNGKIFFNGVQIGSTNDLANTGTDFSLGSSLIARQGQTEIIEIYADAKTTTGTSLNNTETVDVGISVAAADTEGMDSGDTVSAISEVEGFSRTISSSSITLTKSSGYGNQTVIAGTNNVKLGSFSLSAGSTEGLNVNTITVTLSAAEAASITDLMLKDSTTGVQIGTTKVSPSTSNSFSASFTVASNGSKTIDIFGNVKSGANAGSWAANVDGSGTGAVTASTVTFGDSSASGGTLQTITVAGSGTLTVGVGVAPDNANVIAGSSLVKIGSFNFTATNSTYDVKELKVKIPSGAATSVSGVVLKYKNAAGTEVTTDPLQPSGANSTDAHATATFANLTFFVPMNTTKGVDVYVNVPSTVSQTGISGQSITALLDWNDGFKATDGAGNATTTMSSFADLNSAGTSGKGTMVVRKSIPTLSAVALDSSTLTSGSDKIIGRVKITADAAGDIDWGQMVFTMSKTAAVTLGATTTIALWDGSSSIAGTWGTTTAGATLGLGTAQMFPVNAADGVSGSIHFRPTAVRTVSPGSPVTYELRTTIAGVTTSGSNYVDIALGNPSTSVSTAIFSTAAGTYGTSGNASFVWSDWSDTSDHASSATGASTVDWTTDYLIKTLPLTIGNKSVTI